MQWDVGSFWKNYPFHIHDIDAKNPGYRLIDVDPPRIRSNRCRGLGIQTNNGISPCARCSNLHVDVDVVKDRAHRAFGDVQREEDLTNRQLHDKLSSLKETVNKLKLKTVNLDSALASARSRLLVHQDIVRFLGEHQVPALHRIFPNSAKEGWGANKLFSQIKLAAAGDYTARNYTRDDIDLGILVYELGGAGALHALNHSIFALPSRNTIQPYRRQHMITPCVDGLRFSDISDNITAMFGNQVQDTDTSLPERCGHTMSFDELATERRVDYLPETDKMAGFCLEHLPSSGLVTTKVGADIQTVEAAVAAVREGKVHIAHETCVGAISHLSETNYGAKPVFLGPTCKKGTWLESMRTMQTVLEAWKRSPDGERKHGPMLSISTDGDHLRRLALFMLCMHKEIGPGNPLWEYVKNLPGLNLRVGDDNLTGDSDFKHEFKRVRTLFSSPAGMIVKNVCVNRDLLTMWLERLPDHDWSETSIHALLNPADTMNVPNAIKLLLAIVELGKLDPADFDPSEAAELEALGVLAELIDALLQPFINIELSLSQQIQSLIKFSHLLCALYLQNGPSFMPNQLYSDFQTMVKNAILMVPKTRLINGRLKVFICLLGDDVLEALFGRCRMIGGHSPNCSVCQLRDRFSSAMNLDYVYERHPELERRPARLKLFRMRDADHIRPSLFKGEITADSCDLQKCWGPAVIATEQILHKYGVKMTESFAERFKKKNTDLMRPFGGKYPAISAKADRSMADVSSHADMTAGPALTLDSSHNPLRNIRDVDFDTIISQEVAGRTAASADGPHSVFAKTDADGHLTHKKSVVRTLFDMTQDSHTSHDRLTRIRNVFSTLICYNGTHIGMALAKCTLIKNGPPNSKSLSISAVPLAELTLASSPYTVSGQIFSLLPISDNASRWAWSGEFVALSFKKKAVISGDVSRLKNLQFAVSSRLIDPMHRDAQETLTSDILWPTFTCGLEKTWVFSNHHLLASWHRLWTQLNADSTLHDKFPNFTGVSQGFFPYQAAAENGFPGVIYSLSISNTDIARTNADRNSCKLCNKQVKETDRQNHAGEHILKALRGVSDPGVQVPISATYPCGTCGTGTCQIRIKSGKADSDCPQAYAFQIGAASTFRDSRPCTNVPIQCPLSCSEVHWKYNFPQHFSERHPSWRQLIPPGFDSRIRITRAEELALGIPSDKTNDWPDLTIPCESVMPLMNRGTKRPGDELQRSPSRREKENQDPRFDRPGSSKTARFDLTLR
ncbi:hypothetical protein DFH09DRAFT_1019322 [Mycena vulgaris]|nr:hypothetical protein DFH09DRAFT_1019322 [Mycena vulgaris]